MKNIPFVIKIIKHYEIRKHRNEKSELEGKYVNLILYIDGSSPMFQPFNHGTPLAGATKYFT